MIYVFVGTPEMVRAGKPFVVAKGKKVIAEGLKRYPTQFGFHYNLGVAFISRKTPKIFCCENGDTYHAHAWVELS